MLFILLVVLLAENVASVRSPERPVVPNITAISSTEIRITWCRVNSNKVEIDHYELFIDTELEYSGVDVMYMAKRLKPWSWYEVKLRACGFSPGSCSPFSRPALVKTLRDGDNSTVIQSGVTLFKVIVVPTYMFILGMIAGVFAISFVLIWRYLQCADLSSGSAFELPQYQTAPTKKDQSALIMQSLTGTRNNAISSLGSTAYQTKACQVDNDNESHYLEIPNSEKADPKIDKCIISDCLPFSPTTSVQLPSLYLPGSAQEGQVPIPEEGIALNLSDGYPEHQKDEENRDPTHENCTQIENRNETYPLNDDRHDKQEQETQNTKVKDTVQTQERTKHWSNLAGNLIMPLLIQTRKQKEVEGQETIHKEDISLSAPMVHTLPTNVHYQFTEEKVTTEQKNDSSSFSHHGVVVAIDNSNIYIGAQECASMVNPNDRKRHVRLKLQNLVKILERERSKTRGFACGSSPPATDHVWEVYRRLGYIVDLEDRRGKDEQRVDEGLHLWIYKAICELPPGVLVLATGDGMKGKSECDTSFPRCAMTALERGWSVEVYSWKHSLSNEWIKLTKKHPDMLTINYLDKYVNYITFVDGKYGRKCAPLPPEASKLQT